MRCNSIQRSALPHTAAKLAQARLFPNGTLATTTMEAGPAGVAGARFGGEATVESELPNMLLEPAPVTPPIQGTPATHNNTGNTDNAAIAHT